MLFRANQPPPVLTNNSAIIGQSMPQNASNPITPIGIPNHFPVSHSNVSQDVDLRSMGKKNVIL